MKHKNNIQIIGDGEEVMMLAHGYGCDQNMWRFIVPAFLDNFKIVLFDHIGSGKSDITAYDYQKYSTLEGYAEDIIKICEEFGLQKITFVGHSVSSMIGLLSVVKKPSYFQRLIMVGPSPRYINDDRYFGGFSQQDIEELLENLESNYLGWSSAITPVIMKNSERPELTQELENSFCQNNPKIAEHFARVTFLGDNRQDLSKVTIPTLILQCSDDTIAPIEVGTYIHKHMANSTLHILNATGHCPHLSAPEETIEAMKNFLYHGRK